MLVAVSLAPSKAAEVSAESLAQAPQRLLPDVTGVSLQRAMLSLREAGFAASVELHVRADLKRSRVISQLPLPAQQLSSATPVRLVAVVPERAEPAGAAAHEGEEESSEEPVPAFALLDEALTSADQADWRDAQDKLEAARKGAEYPNVLFHLAEAYAHLTEWPEAQKALARFEQIADPHNPHLPELANLRKWVSVERKAVVATHREQGQRQVPPRSRVPLGPLLTVAGGGAVLFSALVTGLLASAKQDELDRHCDTNNVCPDDPKSDLRTVKEQGQHLQLATRILAGVGAAAILGGAAWWLFGARASRVQADAMCSGKGCAASARVRF
jgi:hypothetical protein